MPGLEQQRWQAREVTEHRGNQGVCGVDIRSVPPLQECQPTRPHRGVAARIDADRRAGPGEIEAAAEHDRARRHREGGVAGPLQRDEGRVGAGRLARDHQLTRLLPGVK